MSGEFEKNILQHYGKGLESYNKKPEIYSIKNGELLKVFIKKEIILFPRQKHF